MDALQKIIQQAGLGKTSFPPNSRYNGIETKTMESKNGETVVYLKRRFVPQPERFSILQEHTITEGDRLDNIANQYLGDPELFWQLCDANNALHPEELTESIGSKIRITLPEGIPGNINA